MKKVIIYIIIFLFLISCKNSEEIEHEKRKAEALKEYDRIMQKRADQKKEKELLKEKISKFSSMLSVNRKKGDISGIWYMDSNDIFLMAKFLDKKIKYSDGYCIEISEDLKSANIYFAVTDEVFKVKVEKISETRYALVKEKKKRFFDIINLIADNSEQSYLEWFFEDNKKYESKKGSTQVSNGNNFFDICTSSNQYECSVKGVLERIKDMDNIGSVDDPLEKK